MSINIPSSILSFPGQCVKQIEHNLTEGIIRVICRRDKRYAPRDPGGRKCNTVNRYIRRQVHDIPFLGYPFDVQIELAEVLTKENKRRIEHSEFVDKGKYYSKRFCRLISGLCRHMSISAVANYFNLRWETVKNIDKHYLQTTLPSLNPFELTELKYIGVDEVARAKGHDYMTVVYNLENGQLIWVEKGRTADVFSTFLKQLPWTTAAYIKAVAMDMGPAYQKAVREWLPCADIVFDRFHVMQQYNKAISNQRRVEFRKADKKDKPLIKGSRFLLLKNDKCLDDKQKDKLNQLLRANQNIHTLYLLKEQLQLLWSSASFKTMMNDLEAWCELADQSNLLFLKRFAKSLRKHRAGICNYAKHHLTSARVEAGNVGIGMIRKRARGIRDTDYFKLKIRQLSQPDDKAIFYDSS